MRNKYTYLLLALILTSFLLQYCASPGALQGGPKDEDPPVFIGSDPIKFSTNTKPRKILMEFDEFLVLKDLHSNLIVSPPLNEDPDIKLKGKKVLIRNDRKVEWEENTTYTYFFGDAICDLHEDNPYHNFEYVFSTGPLIDSLSIRGKVLGAQHLSPEESVYVALYKYGMNDTIPFDSLPYFIRPYYVARTNELGEYQLNNIRYDDYMIFAVKDVNNNYYFDLPNEEIAFLDSLLIPQEVYEFIPDSINVNPSDTSLMDSLWKHHSHTMVQNPVDLFMFLQDDSIPRLLETDVTLNKKVDFYFKYPYKDSLKIELLNDSMNSDWYIKEYSTYHDTLSLWFTDFPNDTIEIALSVDTLEIDTLQFVIMEEVKKEDKKKKKRRRKKDKDDKKKKEKEVIQYATNTRNTHDFYKPIKIEFETPLSYVNFEYAQLIEDSIVVTPQYKFTDDLKRHLIVDYDWKEETKYEFVIPRDALKDLFEIPNDSISLKFTTTGPDSYGNIALNIQFESVCKPPFLVQLVQGEGEKEKVIKRYNLESDSLLQINHIAEGDYFLKAIEDLNRDGRWNSGHYGQQLKAESVFFFPLPISVKAGWDIEDNWTIDLDHRKRPEQAKKKDEEAKKPRR